MSNPTFEYRPGFMIAVLLLCVLGFSYRAWKGICIHRSFLYTKGTVYLVQETGNGWIYKFRYYINEQEYSGGVKALRFPMQDSLVWLQVAINAPTF